MKLGSMAFAAVAVLAIASAIGFSSAAKQCACSRRCGAGLHLEFAGRQAGEPARFQGQVGGAIFLSKDFTTGCTIEAHNFQRDLAQYEQKNA